MDRLGLEPTAALVMKWAIRSTEKSYLVMEMPSYKVPRWNNLIIIILQKVKAFVFEAGKIILAISILLWFAASYGPGDQMNQAESKLREDLNFQNLEENEQNAAIFQPDYSGLKLIVDERLSWTTYSSTWTIRSIHRSGNCSASSTGASTAI